MDYSAVYFVAFQRFLFLGWFHFSIERSWRLGDPSMHMAEQLLLSGKTKCAIANMG